MDYGDAVYAGCWEPAGQECAAMDNNSNTPDRQAQLQQQVCELRSELDALHAHYTQLLDRLVPRWRQDRTGLELVTTAAPWSGSSAAPPQQQQQQQHQAVPSAAQAAGNAAQSGLQQQPAAPASRQQQGTGSVSISTTNNGSPGDAARSMLEGQLESARRDLRSAQRTTARLEEALTAAAEAAAGREMSLNTQLRKAKAAATAAAAAAAEERAALAAQVRTLTSDMSGLKSAHAAQLAATQQRLQSLTEQLAAQQLNNLKQHPGQSVASSPTPTDSPSPVLKACSAPQRPKSAAAAATVRPLTTAAAAAGPSRPGSRVHSKPSWVVTGSAALVRQECVKDSLYAGALIDSNAGKDIRLAVDGSSSSSGGGGGSGSGWGCRPSTGPGRGAHTGSSEEAALLLRLRQQVERQVTSELQQKAAALLQVYTATPAAATSAVLADTLEGSALGADDATAAAAAAAAATAETAPAAAAGAAGKSEASAAAVAAGGQSGDELLLAGLAATLQAEVSRLRQQLQSEQQQNQALLVAVRSVQRTQAAAASSYLSGVTRPDSPPMSLKAAAMGAAHTPAAAGVHSRPASAASGRVGTMHWGLQGHQQAPTGSSTKSRPSSAGWRPAVVPWGVSPAAGVLQGSSSSNGWHQAAGQHSSSGPQQDMDLGGNLDHVTVRLTSALSQS